MPAVVTIHKFCSILFISTKSQELPQGLYCKDRTITLGKYLKWPPMSNCYGKSRKDNLPLNRRKPLADPGSGRETGQRHTVEKIG